MTTARLTAYETHITARRAAERAIDAAACVSRSRMP